MAVLRWSAIVLALIVAALAAAWSPLKFVNMGGADFASRLSSIVVWASAGPYFQGVGEVAARGKRLRAAMRIASINVDTTMPCGDCQWTAIMDCG